MWIKTKETEYTVDLASEEKLFLNVPTTNDEPPAFTAMLKWDGCCHIWIHQLNGEPDYIHTDDLPLLIKQLQDLYTKGKQQFTNLPIAQEYWPDED